MSRPDQAWGLGHRQRQSRECRMQSSHLRKQHRGTGVWGQGPRSSLWPGAPGPVPPLPNGACEETGLSFSFWKPHVLLPSTQATASLGQYGASRSCAHLPTFNKELNLQCHPCLEELRNKEWESRLGPPSTGMFTGPGFQLPCWVSLSSVAPVHSPSWRVLAAKLTGTLGH